MSKDFSNLSDEELVSTWSIQYTEEIQSELLRRLKLASDPFRPLPDEVPDTILTYDEIQTAIKDGKLRVAVASGECTPYASGPGFVSVAYATEVLAKRSCA